MRHPRNRVEFSTVPDEFKFRDWWNEQQDDAWVIVAEEEKGTPDYFGTSWMVDHTPASEKALFQKTDFDGHIGDGLPTFAGKKESWEYLPKGIFHGQPEAFIVWRHFHGLFPKQLDIIQEFVLYHNLVYDHARNGYLYPVTQEPVVEWSAYPVRVRVKRDALRDFLAARKQILVRAFDNRLRLSRSDDLPEFETAVRTKDIFFDLSVYPYEDRLHGTNLFCLMRGKFLVRPYSAPKHKDYGFTTRGEDDEDPKVSFIVGIGDDGKQIEARSHVDAEFLTPVFFSKTILQKYHNNPRLYSIEGSLIRYIDEWSIPYGINNAGLVHAWLGDIWQALPFEEQQYWRSFNVLPAGGLEDSFFASQVEAQFVDTSRADHRFLGERDSLDKLFAKYFGFPLFLPIPEHESYIRASFHIPTSSELREFNEQVGFLAKLLVESLNKSRLEKAVADKASLQNAKGDRKLSIEVFEAFLAEKQMAGVGSDYADCLRKIQAVRSKLPAHLTSRSDFDKVLAKAGLSPAETHQEQFKRLLERTIKAMEELATGLVAKFG